MGNWEMRNCAATTSADERLRRLAASDLSPSIPNPTISAPAVINPTIINSFNAAGRVGWQLLPLGAVAPSGAVGRLRALDAGMTGRELAARIDTWVVSVWAFSRPLLTALEWRDAILQLRRSSSGAAANYGAAVFARSHADFTSKVGVALEEMEESWRWLRLLGDAMNNPPRELAQLIDEARQLTAILAASHQTARRNRGANKVKR